MGVGAEKDNRSVVADATLTGTLAPLQSPAIPTGLVEGSHSDHRSIDGMTAVPEAFDGYVLLKPIGRGAMGDVYLARDSVLDRAVAVKLIASLEPGPSARERFLREARAIARLQHPNVVAVYRAGEIGGVPYLVSEFVRGGSLDRVDLPLKGESLIRACIGLASGLAAAHRRGVLHRDLKPANALLSEEGEVKLCDFGLAKLFASAEGPLADDSVDRAVDLTGDLTRAGAWMGTPRYMAPEIWRSEPATVRSDLYALGAMIYKLASGKPAIDGEGLQAIRAAALMGVTRSLREVAPEVPRRLATLIDRCLAPSPEDRPRNADEVCAELLALGSPASSIPQGNPYRGLRPFDTEHRALFFGRSAESVAVVERLKTDALVVVAGDSGVGKSSLCRAGVLALVADGALQDERMWRATRLMPGRHPLAEVTRALAPYVEGHEVGLADALATDPREVTRRLRASLGDARGLVLFVDQLEELVTESEPRERDIVSLAIAELAQRIPGVRVLATARGDFLTRLAALPGLGSELSRALHLLGPLDRTQLAEVIVGPARATGLSFESDEMVDALVRAGGATPLLQFALAELWERRDTDRAVIPAAALASIGGVEGALARHADGVLATLSPIERRAARRLLAQLVTVDGTRAHRAEAELVVDDAARAALAALVRGRLVAAHSDDSGHPVYEVAHEALLSGWTTLRGWLDRDSHQRVVHERLAVAAAEWERLGGARSALWADTQLAEATRVDLSPGGLAGRERAFLEASLREARLRLARKRALIVSAPLLVAALWGGLSLKTRLDRNQAVAAQLQMARPQLAGSGVYASAALGYRNAAFVAYDMGRTADGETLWREALRYYDITRKTYASAMRALETGRELEGRDGRAAAISEATLYARAVLAEVFYRKEEVTELREQLSWLDTRQQWVTKWEAPATLAIASEPAGATLTVAKYEERQDGRRVLGPSRLLGNAPMVVDLAPGSYRLVAEIAGRAPTLYPIRVERELKYALKVPVLLSIPDGFRFVAGGAFLYGSGDSESQRAAVLAEPQRTQFVRGFFIGAHEVTWEEWLDFMDSLTPREREAHRIHLDKLAIDSDGSSHQLRLRPSAVEYKASSGVPLTYSMRTRRRVQKWERFPAAGMTIADGEMYAHWLDKTHRLPGARFCSDREWERAARGADERRYPAGDILDKDDANFDITYDRVPESFGPDEVGSHSVSDSPFGVSDLAGNVWEFVSSSSPGETFIRGGGFYDEIGAQESTNRSVTEPSMRDPVVGLRICSAWEGGSGS